MTEWKGVYINNIEYLDNKKSDNRGYTVSLFALIKVNQAVDSMTEEKSRLESEIEEYKLEITGLENSKAALETENRRLLEKVNALEESKVSEL